MSTTSLPQELTPRWKLIRRLGEGGQGTTDQLQSVSDPTVFGVLKLLKKESDSQARSRMAIEAINLDKLNKGGVKVPRVLEDNTSLYKDSAVQLYLIMDFVSGQTLDKAVEAQGGHLTLDQSIAFAMDLCETIGQMHKLEVMHRDLKPANLMVRGFSNADLVVLDLGLSYDRQQTAETVTRTGETIKNELVVLPEANTPAGDRRDFRSDITNIVCVFFYCLTGHLPRYLLDEKNRLPHQRDGTRPRELLGGDSRAIQAELLLDRGLANDIDGRFQSIEELQDRLRLVAKGTGPQKRSVIQLDGELGAGIRRRSRAVQIQELLPVAQTCANQINAAVSRFASSVKTFVISRAQPFQLRSGLPPGIDLVFSQINSLVVGVKGHADPRIVGLAVGGKGEQCVLLRSNSIKTVQGQWTEPSTWSEVGWFSHQNPPTEQAVTEWMEDIIGQSMQEIDKDIS